MIRREQLKQARNKPSRAPIGCLQHAQLAQVGLEHGAPVQLQKEGKKELGLHATAAVPVVFRHTQNGGVVATSTFGGLRSSW